MTKKIVLSTLVLLFLVTITGCGAKKENTNNINSNNSSSKITENSKSVVLYFSATGTTKSIAQRIANELNSDIIEIIPKEKYKSEDLNYNSDCRANREQNDSKARPEIENTIDITKYDTIYLGYPIWWGTNPKIILTLLDTYDFTGKTIIPFCTSGSTGISGSVNDLRNYNSKLTIKDGKRFSSSDSDETIKDFINNN
jgi:flavodoxin